MPTPFTFLSITAVLSSATCGLYGVYLVLFPLAVWGTYRQKAHVEAAAILRILTIIMFVDLMIHFIGQALEFGGARNIDTVDDQMRWSLPYIIIEGLTTAVAGLISDSLLVWRSWVLCGKKPWLLYLWTSVTAASFCLAVAATLLPLAIFHDTPFCVVKYRGLSVVLMAAWGFIMLTMQTVLTGCILFRVAVCTLRRPGVSNSPRSLQMYTVLLSALVESCVVTWVGLFTYELASFVPKGYITPDLDVGFVMRRLLPIFFGLSQCLVTVHVGFADIVRPLVDNQAFGQADDDQHELTTHFGCGPRDRSTSRTRADTATIVTQSEGSTAV